MDVPEQPVALVTGVSREIGIGRAVAARLAQDGFRVAATGWPPYDERMPWGADDGVEPGDAGEASDGPAPRPAGAIERMFHADLEEPTTAGELIGRVHAAMGPIETLVMCHCESVDSDIESTSVESFDRHMAVNARATWLLIKAFADQFAGSIGSGRIVAFTSDHTAGNLPYGASKGAMDRIVIAAATELAASGITANVINPGATDTGWMTPEIEATVRGSNLQGRAGVPADAAHLVSFLCSPDGQWINGQLLCSDGGRR